MGNMFLKAGPLIFEHARRLRENQTFAESVLWNYLRQKPHGLRFRRQHPLGDCIADFYCHKLKLVIEVDDSIHNREDIKQKDAEKDLFFKSKELKIIRFTDEVVIQRFEQVISELEKIIHENMKKPL
ncbi:endonuclease domain-containing protein [Taibaiella soli]|uniref:DUF559 domain-containing protein n=1 Tax=Taibaiella soli TaxID=1649169 RepID=A0A2W2AZ45_9BACT|nr:endonuclease domain-containing protein [Taibaiella soli]PZF72938.1 hypothetical protein DN068_11035 [Taibaiella soli]